MGSFVRIWVILAIALIDMFVVKLNKAADLCPADREYVWNRFMKSIEFNSSLLYNYHELQITDSDYDSKTGDFFYLGSVGDPTRNPYKFICRSSIKGNIIWITVVHGVVFKSLQYSPTLETVYHTRQHSENFVLILINSIDGSYKESYKVPYLLQHDVFGICTLSDDESAYFCIGKENGYQSTAIIRFDTASKHVNLVYYPRNYKNSRHIDISARNGYEIFFTTSTRVSSYHFIKGSFNFTENLFKEEYHKCMNTRLSDDSVKTTIDEKGETIWYAVEVSDANIMYQQNNISDSSLIGNKYVLPTTEWNNSTGINSIGIMNDTLYIMFYSFSKYYLATIDTSTQKVIKVYETLSVYKIDNRDLLVRNGYVSIFNYRTTDKTRFIHNQVKSGSNIDFLPRYFETKNVVFEKITNSSFDFKDEKLGNYEITNKSKSIYTDFDRISKLEVNVMKASSYIISLPDSFEQEILVGSNQTISKDINLPCSLAFRNLNYTLLGENNNQELPTWVDIDYSNLQIRIQAPVVNQMKNVSFVISTQYPDGYLNNTINIIVTPCSAIEHCIECSKGMCTACGHGYKLSSDSKSCELIHNDDTSSHSQNGQPEYNSSSTIYNDSLNNAYSSAACMNKVNSQYKLIKPFVFIALSLGILLGFVNGLLFDKSFLHDAWSIIHQMQMILLLTLIDGNVKFYVIDLIIQCSFSALSIFLFPEKMLKSIPLIKQLYSIEPDQYLLDLGVTTGSTIVSCILLLIILIILSIIHCLIHCLSNRRRKETYKKHILKMYPRVMIETFIFVMIASLFEIKNHHQHGSNISMILTLLILICEAMFLSTVVVSWVKYSKVRDIDQNSYSSEFYVGIMAVPQQHIQDDEPEGNAEVPYQVKMARLYTSVFLVKRLLMVLAIVIHSESYNSFKIWSSITVQVAYVIYLAKFRCFERVKDRTYEIANEIIYLNFMVMFFVMICKPEYFDIEITILNAILFQSLFLLSGSLYTFITALISRYRGQNGIAYQVDEDIHDFRSVRSASYQENADNEDNMNKHKIKAIDSSSMDKNNMSKVKNNPKEEEKVNELDNVESDYA